MKHQVSWMKETFLYGVNGRLFSKLFIPQSFYWAFLVTVLINNVKLFPGIVYCKITIISFTGVLQNRNFRKVKQT